MRCVRPDQTLAEKFDLRTLIVAGRPEFCRAR